MQPHPSATPITIAGPIAAVQEWFARLSQYCATVDYASARLIFAPDVVSFGTKAKIVAGLDALQAHQWEGIWPNILDFRIELDTIHAGGDDTYAWGIASWSSTGFDEAGHPFDRPGRATVILNRRDGRWLAVHTHFSLAPGVPARTFGKPKK
jgi:ketosteroid isomerase-like protein